MIESVDPADCGGYYLHDAHSWREGFLYLRKRTCRGTSVIHPPKEVAPKPHKHTLVLVMNREHGFIDPEMVVWLCKTCGEWHYTDKHPFYVALTSDGVSTAVRKG